MKLYQNLFSYGLIDCENGILMASLPIGKPHTSIIDSLCPAMTEEDFVRFVCTGKNGTKWLLKYDVDGYLRREKIITEDNWKKQGSMAALCLIKNGADPKSKVKYDEITTTLGELRGSI